MTRRIADLTCPKCKEQVQIPFEVKEPPGLEEITNAVNEALKGQPDQIQKVIREQLETLKPPEGDEAHKHKTADEFIDCPECRLWLDKTATRYKVVPKEPAKEPEPVSPAFGSIFKPE